MDVVEVNVINTQAGKRFGACLLYIFRASIQTVIALLINSKSEFGSEENVVTLARVGLEPAS